MGAFVAFLDVAYGVAGPAAGVVAGHFGYSSVYLLGTACALLAALLAATSRQSAP
jgi:predicted MFS family arabinose efflux permease